MAPPDISYFATIVLSSLSDGRGDYRIHLGSGNGEEGSRSSNKLSNTLGAFYRDEGGLALVMGTLNNPTNRQQLR